MLADLQNEISVCSAFRPRCPTTLLSMMVRDAMADLGVGSKVLQLRCIGNAIVCRTVTVLTHQRYSQQLPSLLMKVPCTGNQGDLHVWIFDLMPFLIPPCFITSWCFDDG